MKTLTRFAATLATSIALAGAAWAQDPIKIALVHGLSGSSFEAFSKQAQTGFELGLEYATKAPTRSRDAPLR